MNILLTDRPLTISLPEGWDANRYKGGAHGSPYVPYEWMG